MCGVAGYSLSESSKLDRTLAAQALLAGIAERGADAVGYAHRTPGEAVSVHKQRSGASALLDEIAVPQSATEVLIHVRDYTKGLPTVPANNHPIRHGAVVGIHNGIIFNDDELLEAHDCARREPGMEVDSEAIFAVAAHSRGDARELEEGTPVELKRGREKARARFTPNREFEETPLPAVRAPKEAAFCLRRLA